MQEQHLSAAQVAGQAALEECLHSILQGRASQAGDGGVRGQTMQLWWCESVWMWCAGGGMKPVKKSSAMAGTPQLRPSATRNNSSSKTPVRLQAHQEAFVGAQLVKTLSTHHIKHMKPHHTL